jgi:hypothetical protein
MKVIVISGSMGAGKTTVMAEASDLLAAGGVVHAAIDADTLGIVHLPGASSTDMMYRNLEAVWRTFAAAGVDRLLLAQAVECRGDIERIRAAVPTANITVCRLTASLETMRRRIKSREPGILQDAFLARVAELNAVLDDARLEDFSLKNEGQSVTEVARELLVRAEWSSLPVRASLSGTTRAWSVASHRVAFDQTAAEGLAPRRFSCDRGGLTTRPATRDGVPPFPSVACAASFRGFPLRNGPAPCLPSDGRSLRTASAIEVRRRLMGAPWERRVARWRAGHSIWSSRYVRRAATLISKAL